MIEAKDLRIGNYVTIDNKESWPMVSGLPMQVISISQRADEDFPNSNASITMQRGIDLFSQFNEFIWEANGGICVLIESYDSPAWLGDKWQRKVYSQAFTRKEPLFNAIKRFFKLI